MCVLEKGVLYKGVFELFADGLVNLVAEIFNGASGSPKHDWIFVIWQFAFWFGVDSNQVQILPNHFNQAIQVPFMVGTNGTVMWQLIQNVELFECDLIDLVDDVDHRDVYSTAFNDIHNVVDVTIILAMHVCIVYSVLRAHSLDSFDVEFGILDARSEANP